MALTVGLFDYGAGNLHSLSKAVESFGARVRISDRWHDVLDCDALVLPGVGAFGPAVQALSGHGDEVRSALEGGLPCLGICLGMQLLFEESDEAEGRGIGLVPGRVERLRGRIVPQIGWNDVETGDDPLFAGAERLVAYYANSFVCRPADGEAIVAWSDYDGDRFAAAVRRGATWGVQFHPEKSSRPGLEVLGNFLREAERCARRPGDEAGARSPDAGP